MASVMSRNLQEPVLQCMDDMKPRKVNSDESLEHIHDYASLILTKLQILHYARF